MKRTHLFWLVIGLLLLLNTGTLAFLFLTRHGGGPHGGPPQGSPAVIITDKLALTAQQQEQYQAMREVHQETMGTLQEDYKKALEEYFELLGTSYTPAQKTAVENKLTAIQQQRVDVTFRHFEALKAICTPDQRGRFATIMPEIANVVIGVRHKK